MDDKNENLPAGMADATVASSFVIKDDEVVVVHVNDVETAATATTTTTPKATTTVTSNNYNNKQHDDIAALTGKFSDGLCDCCDFTCMTCWCPGVAYGALMERLNLTWCANPIRNNNNPSLQEIQPSKTFRIVAAMWFVFAMSYFLAEVFLTRLAYDSNYEWSRPTMTNQTNDTTSDSMNPYDENVFDDPTDSLATSNGDVILFQLSRWINAIVVFYFLLIHTKTRIYMRQQYNIPGSCCCDCMIAWFCSPCSALQIYRHMERSGHAIKRFDAFERRRDRLRLLQQQEVSQQHVQNYSNWQPQEPHSNNHVARDPTIASPGIVV